MRKGILFSTISLIMMSAIFLMISARANYLSSLDTVSLKKVLSDQMQKYSASLERDILKALSITSKRALISCVNYVISNNDYLDDSKLRIEEAVFNGTLYGEEEYLMQENTLTHWRDEVVYKGGNIGFNTSFNFISFNVSMLDSFNVRIGIGYVLNVSVMGQDMRIDKIVVKNISMSVEDFEDPVFLLNTYGRVRRIFIKNPHPNLTYSFPGLQVNSTVIGRAVLSESSNSSFIESVQDKDEKVLVTDNASAVPSITLIGFAGVIGEEDLTPSAGMPFLVGVSNALLIIGDDEKLYIDNATVKAWSLENLEELIDKGYYLESVNGPSFLERLEGKLFNEDGSGLESVVNLEELYANDIPIKSGESLVDYLYFNAVDDAGASARGVKQSWFRIDAENATPYGVSELI